ncbi:MAG: site-specific integrase [Desulfovibrionaceae bacterium]|nr:site-specific integrase [Desulfovibrionaceae bacterium]
MTARKKTRFAGVYERQSATRKFQGKADVAYDYSLRIGGKLSWKCAGWRSEGMTPQEASLQRAEAQRKSRGVINANLTLNEAWEIYLRDWLSQKHSAHTDTCTYKKHIATYFGEVSLAQITPAQVNAMLNGLDEIAPQTKKHIIGLIRRIYRRMIAWAMYAGAIPTDGVQLPRVDNARMRFLTPKEASMLLHELDCRSPQFADICRVSLFSGLRLGEIFRLQVQHINIDARIINVMDAKAGSRVASMPDALATLLIKYTKGRASDEYVFTKGEGGRMHTINQTFVRVVRDLGFNDGISDARYRVVFHTLRHTFASWLVQRGVPLYTVGDLMGHSVLEMTKRYAKLAPDNRKNAVCMLDGIL